ncbi:hypothetical protein HSBAA_25160 [Vreelandella sulfidaeris]|uniref:Uncharacterized protein n=1 Tax=Vreelandella sulfidaeris TaxID=115553 RepID=A0A455U510_9GAMM|nr:hypothetical protein HSBAA_25160 [Halomonas sulfidaeris]
MWILRRGIDEAASPAALDAEDTYQSNEERQPETPANAQEAHQESATPSDSKSVAAAPSVEELSNSEPKQEAAEKAMSQRMSKRVTTKKAALKKAAVN